MSHLYFQYLPILVNLEHQLLYFFGGVSLFWEYHKAHMSTPEHIPYKHSSPQMHICGIHAICGSLESITRVNFILLTKGIKLLCVRRLIYGNTYFFMLRLVDRGFFNAKMCKNTRFFSKLSLSHQAPPSMDFPGKSTGVGCHCLLRYMKYMIVN